MSDPTVKKRETKLLILGYLAGCSTSVLLGYYAYLSGTFPMWLHLTLRILGGVYLVQLVTRIAMKVAARKRADRIEAAQ